MKNVGGRPVTVYHFSAIGTKNNHISRIFMFYLFIASDTFTNHIFYHNLLLYAYLSTLTNTPLTEKATEIADA